MHSRMLILLSSHSGMGLLTTMLNDTELSVIELLDFLLEEDEPEHLFFGLHAHPIELLQAPEVRLMGESISAYVHKQHYRDLEYRATSRRSQVLRSKKAKNRR